MIEASHVRGEGRGGTVKLKECRASVRDKRINRSSPCTGTDQYPLCWCLIPIAVDDLSLSSAIFESLPFHGFDGVALFIRADPVASGGAESLMWP